MSGRIAIVGAPDEQHCTHMRDLLAERGQEVVVIDTRRFPQAEAMACEDGAWRVRDDDLADLRAVWVRSVFYSMPFYELRPDLGADPSRPGQPVLFDDWHRDWAGERERQSFLASFVRGLALRGVKVMNPVEAFDLHYLKLHQLALLRRAGIPVPRTCATNDPARVLAFLDQVGKVVYKPIAGGAACRPLDDRDLLADRLDRLRSAPAIFQEEVPGVDVRVYVMGERIVSSAVIHTDGIDYRGRETGFERVELPADVADLVLRATRLCGLAYTGADLRRRPDGGWVLLECNPSPMFLGFAEATGDPIDEALADLLLAP
ncbi:MAG: hypothetical protein M9894_38915 [Planctomycetes bacterium]|nr:hypothetical protein [Planctomycetota bacterium]